VKKAVLISLLLAGSVLVFFNVDRGGHLRDVDEAAWLFNGAYLDLYITGDWDNQYWRAFDKYAHHPPVGNYLFGALLYAIGEPIKSMEPRRFWYENDLDLTYNPIGFIRGLNQRFTARQVVAGRYAAAAVGFLAAVSIMVLAWRLAGPVAGYVSFFLLILHPAFLDVATLCSIETTIMLFSILCVLFGYEMGCAFTKRSRLALVWCVLCGVCLGLFFATKISAFPWVVAVIISAVAGAEGGRAIKLSLLGSALIFAFAVAVAIVVDPALHGNFLTTTIERVEWRLLRVEIQSILFLGQRIPTVLGRLAFASYWLFFVSVISSVMFVLAITGVVGRWLPYSGVDSRRQSLIVSLAIYSLVLVVITVPLAWMRYVATSVPFIVLLEGLGAACLWSAFRQRRFLEAAGQRLILVLIFVSAFMSTALTFGFDRYRWHEPPWPTQKEIRTSIMFALSLGYPGHDLEMHKELLEYFTETGNQKWADYQRSWIKRMEGRHDGQGK